MKRGGADVGWLFEIPAWRGVLLSSEAAHEIREACGLTSIYGLHDLLVAEAANMLDVGRDKLLLAGTWNDWGPVGTVLNMCRQAEELFRGAEKRLVVRRGNS